jgi:hypothetical protein
MRKLMSIAGLVILSSVVGCCTTETGCSSCGSGCGGTGCGASSGGCGGTGCGTGSGSWWSHRPCTVGVCDCDIPPLAPYGNGLGVASHAAPAPAMAPAQAAVVPADAPKEMPKVAADSTDK